MFGGENQTRGFVTIFGHAKMVEKRLLHGLKIGSLFSNVHGFIGSWAQDLRSGIPICNLARVKCRGDLDLEKSDAELQKLGKKKALRSCCAAAPKRVVRLVTRHI